MVIYLPAQAAEDTPVLDELTPRRNLSGSWTNTIINQADAKRAVAIALRNRIPPPETSRTGNASGRR